jgi:hypothetical protein
VAEVAEVAAVKVAADEHHPLRFVLVAAEVVVAYVP